MAGQGYRFAIMWVARHFEAMPNHECRQHVTKFVADMFRKPYETVVADVVKFIREMKPSQLP